MVRPMTCLSRLSVTLVYCGQTAGWIRIPLGTEVGLGPDDIALDGDPAPTTERGTAAPTFRSVSTVAKRSPISAAAELLFGASICGTGGNVLTYGEQRPGIFVPLYVTTLVKIFVLLPVFFNSFV